MTSSRDIPFGRPMIGDEEKEAVAQVLSGHMLTHGPRVKEFEAAFAEFTGAGYAIAAASCTAALHLAYFSLDLAPGDEVIVPTQTHVATAHAVELCGARAVFADSERETGNIDISQLEPLVTDRTRAIAIVHYLGMPINMPRVVEFARKHDLFVVEDCALAIGTYLGDTHAGLYGDVGCFSFYPVKHITTAEGGMLITNRQDVAKKISLQRAFGIDRNIVSEREIPGMYDVEALGFNYRMTEIGAALGLAQMKRVGGFLRQRRENYERLDEGLRTIDEIETLQSSHDEYQSSYYCHSMLLRAPWEKKRFEIMSLLKEKGVGTSIYYPRAVPHMTYYKARYGFIEDSYPVATWISNHSIALPVGPHLDSKDMAYMAKAIKEVFVEVGKNG